MQLEVISISPERKQSKGKNVWFEFDLKFLTQKGEQERTFRSFEDVYKVAKLLQPKDKVTALVVKDGNYWNWKEINIIENPGNEENPKPDKPEVKSAKSSSWETAEERAFKQRAIVRQSSISNAIALLVPQGAVNEYDVIKVARVFEDFVYGEEIKGEEKIKTNGKAKKIKEVVKEAGQDDIPF